VVKPKAGTRVWRKDVLGYAGTMYRDASLPHSGSRFFHFEVFTTDEAFKKFWCDSEQAVEQAGKNGSKELWGSNYFIVPANTDFKDKHPEAGKDKKKPNAVNGIEFPPQSTGQNTQKLYVEIRYDKGAKYTVVWAAQDDGSLKRLTGEAGVKEDDYEYELYNRATKLYPDCPSAGYELLRFGRIIGPDALAADKQANWQAVTFAEGKVGYVNLSDAKILKLSDADFPHFKGWLKCEESDAAFMDDGLCDTPQLLKLMKDADTDGDNKLTDTEWKTYVADSGREKLRRLVCRFPTEWDGGDNEKRFGRLKDAGQVFHENPPAYQSFLDHLKPLQFWSETGLPTSVWHFHPMEFVRHFKRCGWFSTDELIQFVPSSFNDEQKKVQKVPYAAVESRLTSGGTPQPPAAMGLNLDKMMRKYGVATALRQAHFWGQILQETGQLLLVIEGGADSYFKKYDGRTDLGNTEPDDGKRFKGRGVIQLTGRTNYEGYGDYRNQTFNTDDTTTLLASDAFNACDASGYYWVKKQRYQSVTDPKTKKSQLTTLGKLGINYWADNGAEDSDIENCTRAVNGGTTHMFFRRQFFCHAYYVVNDLTTPPSEHQPQRK